MNGYRRAVGSSIVGARRSRKKSLPGSPCWYYFSFTALAVTSSAGCNGGFLMPKTQNEKIKEYLENGHKLTPLEALNLFGCFRLASRVSDLKKQGMKIETEIVTDNSTGKRYAVYYLTKVEPRPIQPGEITLVCEPSPVLPVNPDGELF